jgi:AcrR family transcriptional regulator
MRKRRKARKPKAALGSLNNSRTYALYRAGLRLLTDNDCDAVSVAQIAKAAECSVGAFYERFPDKNAYLIFLIRSFFRTEINWLEEGLPESISRNSGVKSTVEDITRHIVTTFSGDKMAGVVRAALKLAPTHPEALAPISEYRDTANESAHDILKPRIKSRDLERRVKESMQMTFAVIFDAIQQNYGPLRLNSGQMNAVLSRRFQTHLLDKTKLPPGGILDKPKLRDNKRHAPEIELKELKLSSAEKKSKSRRKAAPAKRRNVKVL